ncbi:MAG: hypothetical protein ACE5PV_03795 [Candidatus Poribacteria bacterium]
MNMDETQQLRDGVSGAYSAAVRLVSSIPPPPNLPHQGRGA